MGQFFGPVCIMYRLLL